MLDFATGETKRISPGMGKTTCAFFRPGTDQILFASTHHDPKSKQYQDDELAFRASGKERRYAWDYDPEMEIYAFAEKTGALTRLTNARGYDAEAAYSPDGQWIVVLVDARRLQPHAVGAGAEAARDRPELLRRDLHHEGGRLRPTRLTNTPGYDGGPFFTTDGQRIVWRRFDEQGLIADVWTMKLDGTDAKQVTHFKSMSWAPYEHPSGEYFLFASNKLGFENFEMFMVDKAGAKEPVRITYSDGFDGLPVPSPDGKQIASRRSARAAAPGRSSSRSGTTRRAMKALAAAPPRKWFAQVSRFRLPGSTPSQHRSLIALIRLSSIATALGADGGRCSRRRAGTSRRSRLPGSRGGWPVRRARSWRPTTW